MRVLHAINSSWIIAGLVRHSATDNVCCIEVYVLFLAAHLGLLVVGAFRMRKRGGKQGTRPPSSVSTLPSFRFLMPHLNYPRTHASTAVISTNEDMHRCSPVRAVVCR